MKDSVIVSVVAAGAALAGVTLFLTGPGKFWALIAAPAPTIPYTATTTVVSVPFTEVAHGTRSTVTKRVNYVITSPVEFKKLWDMVDAKGKAPDIDFSEQSVVAVFAGKEPTTGYSIAVAKVEDRTAARRVSVIITKPGSGCIIRQSMTAPYQLIELPKTSLLLTHQDLVATSSCSG